MLAQFDVEQSERRLVEQQIALNGHTINPRLLGRVLRAFIRYVPAYYFTKHRQRPALALKALEADRTIPVSTWWKFDSILH